MQISKLFNSRVNIFFLLALFSFNAGSAQTKYYIAPTGNDKNTGNIDDPFAHWEHINSIYKDGRLKPGDTVFIRGGMYRSEYGNEKNDHVLWSGLKGSAEAGIVIMAYPGEHPVLNLDDKIPSYTDPTALKIENCYYIHLKGLRITGLKQVANGKGVSRAVDISYSKNCKFEFLEIDHIGGYGLIVGDSTVNSMFLNIDAHHIYDSLTVNNNWNNANGIQCSGGSSADNDTFRFCRTWKCSDDGFDFYRVNGRFVLEGCWSFWNGYKPNNFQAAGDGSGFKLGPDKGYPAPAPRDQHEKLLRTVTNCLAFENRKVGFNQNAGDMKFIMYNNTSYHNGDREFGYGFMWDFIHPAPKQDFKNNISLGDLNPRRGTETTGSNNTWNKGFAVSAHDFISIVSKGMDGPRQADGSLPKIPFMHLGPRSALVNSGTKVGLSFIDKPDLGAFEYIP